MVLYKKISSQNKGSSKILHMMKSLLNCTLPNSKEQLIRPKGVKLLPVADLTLMFHMV